MWLLFSGATALLAIAVGFLLMPGVLAEDEGTPKMQEIALAIQEGALAYLKRQFKTIVVILVPLVVIVFVTSTKIGQARRIASSLSFAPVRASSGPWRSSPAASCPASPGSSA